MFHWKLAAVGAGAAFLISLLAGIVGGVGFGTLLLRAILGGALIGALVLGLDLLARRFLPELYTLQSSPTKKEDEGATVDITIDEEPPRFVPEGGETQAEGEATEEPQPASGQSDEEAEESPSEEMPEIADEEEDNDGDETFGAEEADGGYSAELSPRFDSAAKTPTVEILGREEDPAVIAQAVRTLLKKDQEG